MSNLTAVSKMKTILKLENCKKVPLLSLLATLADNLQSADVPLTYSELRLVLNKAELDDSLNIAFNKDWIIKKNTTEDTDIYLITQQGIDLLKRFAPEWEVKKPIIHTKMVIAEYEALKNLEDKVKFLTQQVEMMQNVIEQITKHPLPSEEEKQVKINALLKDALEQMIELE